LAGLGNAFEKSSTLQKRELWGFPLFTNGYAPYWLERNRKCIGFRWLGPSRKPDKSAAFVHPDNKTPVERVSITNGRDIEDLWYPWDFCFTPDTKVPLLDGRNLTLEQIYAEFVQVNFGLLHDSTRSLYAWKGTFVKSYAKKCQNYRS